MTQIIQNIGKPLLLTAMQASLLLWLLYFPATLWAHDCTCKGQTVEEAYQTHPLIFFGKLVDETRVNVPFYIDNDVGQRVPLYQDQATRFEIYAYPDEHWRGNPEENVILIHSGSCPLYLLKKGTYLIYAFPNREKKGIDGMGMDRCTRTVRYLDSFPEQFALNDILRKGAPQQENRELHLQASSDKDLDQRARALRQLGLLPGKSVPENRLEIFLKAVQHKDVNVRLTALIALHDRRLKGYPKVIRHLKENLQNNSPYVRAVAVFALTEVGNLDEPTVTQLLSLFDSEPDLPVKYDKEHDMVFNALSHALSGSRETEIAGKIVPHMLKRIRGYYGWRYPVRMQVTEDLRNLGPLADPAVPRLKELLNDEIQKVRESAAQTLKAIGTPAALEALK